MNTAAAEPSFSEDGLRIPHEIYNYIVFKCFDSCVTNFDNKVLDTTEHHCVQECTTNLKEPPTVFQRSQQLHGFLTPDELRSIQQRKNMF